ncbi:hypothetical protein [Pseudonocardia sp. MH-G8]|uniref:hypothetical protein n=1 Tax=Pseudonocardia sp. MH-G8 TaxID=1854588 RepID=UPI001179A8C5|nr:hypothetical protein [Pseudonocardia sp. MH-G8]
MPPTAEDLVPIYDVFFARPDLDLLRPGLDGRQVLENFRLWADGRADLVARAEAYLAGRGAPGR